MLVQKVQFSELSNHRTPVFNYCRQLLKEGVDPSTRLECYRNNDEPDLIVSSIGYGAKLTVIEDGNGSPRSAKYQPYPTNRGLNAIGSA